MPKMRSGIKSPAFLTTALVIVVGTVASMWGIKSAEILLYLVPFTFGPLFVSLAIAAFSSRRSSQITLIVGSILYAGWFGYIYIDEFYWHVDLLSGVALIAVGIYSLPVMIPIWLVALVLRRRNKLKGEQASGAYAL